jgi:phage gp36-like protein
MAYSSVEDVRVVLRGASRAQGQPQEANLNANTLDDDQIEYAISSADMEIDAALRGKYILPIRVNRVVPVETPVELHDLSVDIASYLATLIYRADREFASSLASVLLRYNRAKEMLTGIAAGTVVLEIDQTDSSSTFDGTVFNPYDGPLFPSANIFNAPEGYIPPDYLYR